MTSFNVLDRKECVHRHLLLEASAGTGKTFSIENIVVRLLIESRVTEEPLLIENILVVTFTRMAAGELKERIHSNLENFLELIKRFQVGENVEDQFPDYLLAFVEKGVEALNSARRRIERALFSFDRAQIFTIHGFCWRMLKNYSMEAGISLEASSREDNTLSVTQLMQVIRDFLRKELVPSIYSPQQLKIMMHRAKKKSEKLQQDLFNQVMRGINIQASPSFSDYLMLFQAEMKKIKEKYTWESKKIIEDFLTLAPFYKELRNVSKQVYPEKMAKVERFAALFDQEEWNGEDLDVLIEDGLFLLEAFDPTLLMAKAKPITQGSLHYPHLLELIQEHLKEVISQARNEVLIFSRLASDCQKFVMRYLEQEEFFGHSDLLVQMRKAIDRPEFVKHVRSNFSAAIVDEFQDTDPVQWEIFSNLFASKNEDWKGFLNLVGDPKQSIYAFRQADIYTYLSAAEKLGSDSLATLDTNFRSKSSLIDALNILFHSSVDTFSLPKISNSLPYRCVHAGRKSEDSKESLDVSLHFWEVKNQSKLKNSLNSIEKDYLFPAIANEILFLNDQQNMHFNQFAILIADRYQAERVCSYLQTLDIPVKSQKGKDLSRSLAIEEMRDLLNGVMNYTSKSRFNVALASRLIGRTHQELLLLENENFLVPLIEQFHQLKKIFCDSGFSKFYHSFMNSSWHGDGKTVLERLLNELNGLEFYREWQDLADLMIAEEQAQSLLPEGLIAFLEDLEEYSRNEDERIKAFIDPQEDGVSVLTTHVSKGLEFDVVFALGLTKRTKLLNEDLVPFEDQQQYTLCAVNNEQDPRYLKFCEESDAEKMRQLYVALTRAKEKLYVPYIIEEYQKRVPFGSASPIELFIARLDKPKTHYEGLYERIFSEDGSTIERFIEKYSTNMFLSKLNKQAETIRKKKATLYPQLIPPNEVCIPGIPQAIQSFTSLSHVKAIQWHLSEDSLIVPHDFSSEEKTEHTLPAGNEVGIILHKIFENIAFDSVKKLTHYEQMRSLITPFLKATSFVLWEEVIAKIVFKTLKTNLGGYHNFCLADINSKKIYRETEFLYPCDTQHTMFKGIAAKPGFLKGVVDVFFEYQGKFYLLDWKSNWLGPSNDYYGLKHLQEAMRTNHYDLQAAIYYEAFQRYLKIFDKRPFDEIFGGVFYLFVRGMSEATGIVHLTGNRFTG